MPRASRRATGLVMILVFAVSPLAPVRAEGEGDLRPWYIEALDALPGEETFIWALINVDGFPVETEIPYSVTLDGVPVELSEYHRQPEWRGVEAPWVASLGSHTLVLTIDPENVIPESDETNNVRVYTFVIQWEHPDLALTLGEIREPSDPAALDTPWTRYIDWEVCNEGNWTSQSAGGVAWDGVAVFAGPKGWNQKSGSLQPLQPLEPGACHAGTTRWTGFTGVVLGDFEVAAEVMTEGRPSEMTWDNNQAQAEFSVLVEGQGTVHCVGIQWCFALGQQIRP